MVDRKCDFPRGKGVGGSTLINGLIYARGNKRDYDRWAAEGNPGWSYNEVLPWFLKSENVSGEVNADPFYHGRFGPMKNQYVNPVSSMYNAFIDGNKELHLREVDYNSATQTGVGRTQFNVDGGFRLSNGRAYVKPALQRNNLIISTGSYVTKIRTNKKRVAEAVEFTKHGRTYLAKASKEIILSAGTVGSPQILMLSGIGPADHLNSLGIPFVKNLSVGNNLYDHAAFWGLTFNTNVTDPLESLDDNIIDALSGKGAYLIPNNVQALSFYETKYRDTEGLPDAEFLFVPPRPPIAVNQRAFRYSNATFAALVKNILAPRNFFNIIVVLENPKSTGTIRLKSNDPFDYPLIDPKMLSEHIDLVAMVNHVQIALKLTQTEAFRRINTTLARVDLPNCVGFEYLSVDYWKCFIRHVSFHIYHPIGTCKMGRDPKNGAVVDNKLRVHGIGNLRVADASVFPFPFAGHPGAYCTMLGEKLADIIKFENWPFLLQSPPDIFQQIQHFFIG